MNGNAESAKSKISQVELYWLFGLVGAYTLVFFALACRKYDALNSNGGDAAAMIQAFWQTLHGKIMYVAGDGMSYLGNHAGLLVLWALPLYWLFPSAYTLYFAQSLSIGASGIPFYLIARHVLGDRRGAAFLTVAYLFYPTVVTNHLDQLHMEVFALPFLLAAAYFFFERRMEWFLVFALLGMMGQENLPLTVGAFGVYAAVRRRGIKWVMAPLVLAAVYGVVALKVIMPYFAGGQAFLATRYHEILGRSPDEFVKTAMSQPWQLVGALVDWEHVLYVVEILQPLLWITPLLVSELLLAAPALGMNLMLDNSYRVIAWHYGPTMGAFLCVAAIFGVRKLAPVLETRWHLAQPPVTLAFCMGALSVASWPLWFNFGELMPQPYQPTLWKAVELVSKGQSVVAPSTLIAQVAGRGTPVLWTQFDQRTRLPTTWPVERMYTMDYAILDANERRFPQETVTRDLVMSFYTNTNYQLVLNENNVFVFEHR